MNTAIHMHVHVHVHVHVCVCVCVCVCVQEFNLETKTLENYFLILSAIEDNLVEFKKIQEQLAEVYSSLCCITIVQILPLSSHSLSLPPPSLFLSPFLLLLPHHHAQIVQEIKALMTLDDVSDDEVFELSAMAAGPSHVPSSSTGRTASISDPEPRRRRFNSMVRVKLSMINLFLGHAKAKINKINIRPPLFEVLVKIVNTKCVSKAAIIKILIVRRRCSV